MKKWILSIVLSSFACGIVSAAEVVADWELGAPAGERVGEKSGAFPGAIFGEFKPETLVRNAPGGHGMFFSGGKYGIRVDHAEALSLVNDFAIECFFRPDRVDDFRTICWKGYRYLSPERINYYVSLRNGAFEFKFKDRQGEWTVCQTPQIIRPGNWYQALISFKDGRVSIWINGKEQKVSVSDKAPSRALVANDDPLYIGTGGSRSGVQYNFCGVIAALRFYRGAKTPSADDDFSEKLTVFYRDALAESARNIAELEREYAALSASLPEKMVVSLAPRMAELARLKTLSAKPTDDLAAQLERQNRRITLLRECKRIAGYAPFFDSAFGKGRDLGVVCMSSARRLFYDDAFYLGLPRGNQAELRAARNEREGIQLIACLPPGVRDAALTIKVSPWRHENGKGTLPMLEWGAIRAISSQRPEYEIDFVGPIPDLIEVGSPTQVQVAALAQSFLPLFFRAAVPEDAAPGIYRAEIEVAAGKTVCQVPVTLKVADFTLPRANSLKTAFSFFLDFYKKWYGIQSLSAERQMEINRFLIAYRIPPNNIYSSEIEPSVAMMKQLAPLGANFMTLGYFVSDKTLGETELNNLTANYAKRYQEVTAAGLADFSYLYLYDEMSGKQLASVRQVLPHLKKAIPGLRTMQTSLPTAATVELFDIWVPLFSAFDTHRKEIQAMQKGGTEFWWYAADWPNKPFPNFFLDYPVFDARIVSLLSTMYDVRGMLYWCVNREWSTNMELRTGWTPEQWRPYIVNVFTRQNVYRNGMGNLIYPGPDGALLPSLRLENLRDGLEDYEYWTLLKSRCAAYRKKHGEDTVLRNAEALLTLPSEVATAVNRYSPDPEHLQAYRERMARAIEALNR